MSGNIDNFVDWSEFEAHRLTSGAPETKQSKTPPPTATKEGDGDKKAGPVSYCIAPLNYLYKRADGTEVKDTFAIQLCESRAYGIQPPSPGFKDFQIRSVYNKDKEEVKNCMRKMDEVHARMVDLLLDPVLKGPMKAGGKLDATLTKLKGMGFAKLIPFPKDKITDEPDMTKHPNVYYKLNNFSSSKTKFIMLDHEGKIKNPEWKEMENAEFSGKPIINYRTLFSNGITITAQGTMASYAITDLKYKGGGNIQAEELKKMAQVNPEMVQSVTSGYKEIVERMAAMSAGVQFKSEDNAKKSELPSGSQTLPQVSGNAPASGNAVSGPPGLSNLMKNAQSGAIPQGQGQFYGNINPVPQQQQPQSQAHPQQQSQIQGQTQQQPQVQQPQSQLHPQQQPQVFSGGQSGQDTFNLPPGFNAANLHNFATQPNPSFSPTPNYNLNMSAMTANQ